MSAKTLNERRKQRPRKRGPKLQNSTAPGDLRRGGLLRPGGGGDRGHRSPQGLHIKQRNGPMPKSDRGRLHRPLLSRAPGRLSRCRVSPASATPTSLPTTRCRLLDKPSWLRTTKATRSPTHGTWSGTSAKRDRLTASPASTTNPCSSPPGPRMVLAKLRHHRSGGRVDHYLARDGYQAHRKMPGLLSWQEVMQDVIKHAGSSWPGRRRLPNLAASGPSAARPKSDQRYLICNADEGDPGAFMNRSLDRGRPPRPA